MRQTILSNTVTATYDEKNETYAIQERPYKTKQYHFVMLNRDEMSNLIDFACQMMQRKLAFYCHRCQPQQKFDSLKGLVDHSEQAHLVHLVDLQRRLQGEA